MLGLINIEPTLVNRLKYSLVNVTKENFLNFITRNGYFVRNLEIEGYWRIASAINFNQLPRLKELSVKSMDLRGQFFSDDGLDVTSLRCLKTYNMTDLEDIIHILSNTKNLTTFEAKFDNNANHELWTNFIFQQHNLRDLSLTITSDQFNFPYRDVKDLVKFKLKNLKLSVPRIDQNLLLTFLNTQGASLQSLDLQITDETNFPSRFTNNEVKFHPSKLKLCILNAHEENFQAFIESQAEQLEELDLEIESDSPNFLERPIMTGESVNLMKLKLCLKDIKHENLLDLLKKLNNLKDLELIISDMDMDEFPCRDVSKEIAFRLKRFRYSLPDINQERFVEFLKTQAESLEELELNSINELELLEQVFKKLKKIKKLIIDGDVSNAIFYDGLLDSCLETLQYFEDKNQNGTNVTILFKYFPNIEELKCCDTMRAKGTYEKLTTLDVSEVYWARIHNLKLPNLKKLFIKKVDKLNDDYYWTHFPKNFLNVENITVHSVGIEDRDVFRFVKRLKNFKSLKTFKIRQGIAINHQYEMDENEKVEVGKIFFKILLDTTKRTVRVSTYIAKNRLDIMKILQKTFKKFEYFEFCFEELKMRKICKKELRKSIKFVIPRNEQHFDQE